ncbi:hypothetical protein N752_29045 [Desulforamulus aquiferis]|nr:DUF58 domain-containing protein [Desulforamulus aquiferis]RYD01626.1 hypothetical protein N752_29045 [Desulforamulus aquiferis]
MARQETHPDIASYFSIGLVRIILLLFLLVSLRYALWLPALLLLFLVFTLESAAWWSKFGLRDLVVAKQLKHLRCFPGEHTTLTLQITNPKRLPSIIGWQQTLPVGLSAPDIKEKAYMLTRYQSATRVYEIKALGRGYWQIPGLQVSSQDGLGLFERHTLFPDNRWLIVYPSLIPLEQLSLEVSDLLGDKKIQRPYMPDPVRPVSLREYTYDTPARLIHWKASLSKDQLYAKVLEPSGDYKIYILMDVSSFARNNESEKFEKALSVAATIISWAQELNIPFGLLINGRQKASKVP